MALVLSHMRGTWEHSSQKSLSVYLIQSSCEQQLASWTYSASVVHWATLDCLQVLMVVMSLFSTFNFEQISLHQILHHSCRVIN
jgi:hypothetical protein